MGKAKGKAWRPEIESTCSVSHDTGGLSLVPRQYLPFLPCCTQQRAVVATNGHHFMTRLTVTHSDGPRGPRGRLEAQKGNRLRVSTLLLPLSQSKNISQVRSSLYFIL